MTDKTPEFVRMTHPKSEGAWNCPAGYVERAEAKGWKKAPAEKKSASSAGDGK